MALLVIRSNPTVLEGIGAQLEGISIAKLVLEILSHWKRSIDKSLFFKDIVA
jgi:hypothetical protein